MKKQGTIMGISGQKQKNFESPWLVAAGETLMGTA